MKASVCLLGAELKALSSWFQTQSVSKILVFVSFLAVLASLSLSLFVSTNHLFGTLASYGIPGWLIASYVIHVAIIIIFWLGIGSSIVSTANSFLAAKNLDYILALPVKENSLIFYFFIRTIFTNVVFLVVVFAPIAFSFALSFLGGISWYLLLRLFFVLFSLAILTHGIGSAIAFSLLTKLKGKGYFWALFGLIFFLLTTFVILRLVLPPQLLLLEKVDIEEFISLYYQLPLIRAVFPTSWLAKTLTEGGTIYVIYASILVAFISWLSFRIQSRNLIKLFQILSLIATKPVTVALEGQGIISQFLATTSFDNRLSSSANPLFLKDWLSIIRSPAEIGYGIFFLFLALFSLSLFTQISYLPTGRSEWQIEIVSFSFMWLVFFATAFFLRLVFPLMAKEVQSAWYIFTLPLSQQNILSSKILLSVVLSLPLVIPAIFIWLINPLVAEFRSVLILTSIWAIVLLALIHGLLGSIYPNFASGQDSEKVSTSGMGIIALTLSFFLGFLFTRGIKGIIENSITGVSVLVIYSLFTMIIIFALYRLALRNINRYQF